MDTKGKLLIIDDDPKLVEGLGLYLRTLGYEVISAPDGRSGLQQFYGQRPDLVILDLMMPRMDGWEVCQRIREVSDAPIIMLTARGQQMDRVMGLKMGADDYVSKPFDLKELEARVEAVLRRTRLSSPAMEGVRYVDGRLVIDPGQQVVLRDGEPLNLTPKERRLLFYLAAHAGQTLSVRQILRGVWGPQYEDATDSVKFYIWRLRQKIEDNPKDPHYILTEWGLGYRFAKYNNRSRAA
ncbi:MAG: response regulator transcription factor [Anaerolineae bacterium]